VIIVDMMAQRVGRKALSQVSKCQRQKRRAQLHQVAIQGVSPWGSGGSRWWGEVVEAGCHQGGPTLSPLGRCVSLWFQLRRELPGCHHSTCAARGRLLEDAASAPGGVRRFLLVVTCFLLLRSSYSPLYLAARILQLRLARPAELE
jgi:hypothetical protein